MNPAPAPNDRDEHRGDVHLGSERPSVEQARNERLVVADSFRVRVHEGGVEARGFGRHLARFARSVAEVAASTITPRDVTEFLAASRAEIAAYGEGFPRLELWETGEGSYKLKRRLRPLPHLGDSIALRTAPSLVLERPELKGANLVKLNELNGLLGAEALLVDDAGTVIEGATTALAWWKDDTLCTVLSGRRVASVTESLILTAAAIQGVPHERCHITVAELRAAGRTGMEVWALNALHGIRLVTSLDGEPLADPTRGRLARFRALLDRTWEPVAPSRG